MGLFLKYLVHLVANILWQSIGGKGAVPPVRLPKGKKPVTIPVVSPWQTVVVMWVARKAWAAFGSQFKDILASSPHDAAKQVGSWLPNPSAKAKASKATEPKPAAPAAKAPAAPRAAHTWTASAQPAGTGPTPSKATPPASPATQAPAAPQTPRPATRPSPNYATRQLDDQDAAPDYAAAAAVAPVVPSPPAQAPVTAPPATPPTPTSMPRIGSLLASLRRGSSS